MAMKLECRAGGTRTTDGIFRVVGGKTRTTRLQRRGGRANSRKSTRTFKRCCIYTANTRHCAAGAYGTCFPTKGLTFSCAKRRKSACWWCSTTRRRLGSLRFLPAILRRKAPPECRVCLAARRRSWLARKFASARRGSRFRFSCCTKKSQRELQGPVVSGFRHGERDGMRAGVVMPCLNGVVADADFFGFHVDAVDGYAGAAPPRVKRTVRGAAGDGDGGGRDVAGIVHAVKLTFLVGEGVTVVFVE